MTGRGAARDHDERPTGPTGGDEPGPASGAPRGAGVAPQPRLVPTAAPDRPGDRRPTPSGRAAVPRRDGTPEVTATPARPTPAAPAPTPARPSPTAPVPSPARPNPPGPTAARAPVEVEPTTGAPVDAVPRRVPVRQQSRQREVHRADGDRPPDDEVAFWAPIEEVHWDGTPVREDIAPRRRAPARARRSTSRTTALPDPLPGLTALVVLSLVAAFFAWVSAGPFWLAVGHARDGTVVIDDCTGGGLTQRCRGIFTADDGRFLAHGVRVSGVPAGGSAPGTALPARMTGPDGGTAYADTGAGRHLRWLPGLLGVLGCTAGIVRWTGSARLPGRRHRRLAVAAALAGPALITLGFLAAAW
ncbi:hypothetical protein OOJ91_25155 [Micromonospora lupini]|uniref:hypothetical protein n=1 Tax=Micromonospora lupini TaxID=285679 RepID=UPI00224E44B5|nr:hypothetical protein [Micromonospora lupini]MCX5069136.1 hypothetical protein [Micromonospora lupini]